VTRAALIASTLALLAAAPASADILIGVAGPMTGSFAVLGQQMTAGAGMAVADINAAGGVLGEPLALSVGDDLCTRKEADAVANQMTGRRILFMAGHLCSTATMAAAPIYAEAKIVEITPGSTNPKLTDERAGPGFFRLAERDDRQGPAVAALIAGRFRDARVAVVHDDAASGKAIADSVTEALGNVAIRPVLADTFESGGRDYMPLVSRLKDARIDVVFIGGLAADAGLIVRQMRAAGMTAATAIGGDSLLSDDFWQAAGDAGDGTLVTYPPDPALAPEAAEIVRRFRAAGIEPEAYVLPTYAAVQVYAAAVAKAGGADFAKVSAAIAASSFDTVIGKVAFDAKGDMTRPGFVVYEWKAGRYGYPGN
jgi:branched-chain amino acid transport system substrate-binding protein